MMLGILMMLDVSSASFVSASAGLGGSLVLVPMLTLVLGTKEGVSTAAVLLAANNLLKLWAYRQVLPLRPAALVTGFTLVGRVLGASLMVASPEILVSIAVVASLGLALIAEKHEARLLRGRLPWVLALFAGATSGFSGTSGPLKGVAIRSLGFDRLHTIGAAALVSTAADVSKTAVFAGTGLLKAATIQFAVAALPLMLIATLTGRHFAQAIGEKGYARLFWFVIGGYTLRLLLVR